ncbi:MAG: hypothetical protein GY862_02875 [Gammaproteobacteria bacterium]|nr:hypothetical protein [Gammaproteobacteria bacterium]
MNFIWKALLFLLLAVVIAVPPAGTTAKTDADLQAGTDNTPSQSVSDKGCYP